MTNRSQKSEYKKIQEGQGASQLLNDNPPRLVSLADESVTGIAIDTSTDEHEIEFNQRKVHQNSNDEYEGGGRDVQNDDIENDDIEKEIENEYDNYDEQFNDDYYDDNAPNSNQNQVNINIQHKKKLTKKKKKNANANANTNTDSANPDANANPDGSDGDGEYDDDLEEGEEEQQRKQHDQYTLEVPHQHPAFTRLKARIVDASIQHLQFWDELSRSAPDAGLIQDVCYSIDAHRGKVRDLAKTVFKHSPNNVYVHHLYGRYLVDIENNVADGQRILERITDIEDSARSGSRDQRLHKLSTLASMQHADRQKLRLLQQKATLTQDEQLELEDELERKSDENIFFFEGRRKKSNFYYAGLIKFALAALFVTAVHLLFAYSDERRYDAFVGAQESSAAQHVVSEKRFLYSQLEFVRVAQKRLDHVCAIARDAANATFTASNDTASIQYAINRVMSDLQTTSHLPNFFHRAPSDSTRLVKTVTAYYAQLEAFLRAARAYVKAAAATNQDAGDTRNALENVMRQANAFLAHAETTRVAYEDVIAHSVPLQQAFYNITLDELPLIVGQPANLAAHALVAVAVVFLACVSDTALAKKAQAVRQFSLLTTTDIKQQQRKVQSFLEHIKESKGFSRELDRTIPTQDQRELLGNVRLVRFNNRVQRVLSPIFLAVFVFAIFEFYFQVRKREELAHKSDMQAFLWRQRDEVVDVFTSRFNNHTLFYSKRGALDSAYLHAVQTACLPSVVGNTSNTTHDDEVSNLIAAREGLHLSSQFVQTRSYYLHDVLGRVAEGRGAKAVCAIATGGGYKDDCNAAWRDSLGVIGTEATFLEALAALQAQLAAPNACANVLRTLAPPLAHVHHIYDTAERYYDLEVRLDVEQAFIQLGIHNQERQREGLKGARDLTQCFLGAVCALVVLFCIEFVQLRRTLVTFRGLINMVALDVIRSNNNYKDAVTHDDFLDYLK